MGAYSLEVSGFKATTVFGNEIDHKVNSIKV